MRYTYFLFYPYNVYSRTITSGICYFVCNNPIALIPLAKLIGDSTEHLSTHYGSILGSLIKVTFGNAAEIIIEVVAINAGLLEFVNASITGSIPRNIMLIFGLYIITRGLRHKEQLLIRKMQNCNPH